MRGLEEIKRENIEAARRAATAADRSPRVVCNQCSGAGHHKISDTHAGVYDVLTSGWQGTETIREALHKRGEIVSPTALVNRLNYLVDFRLAERRPCPTNTRRLEWRVR